MQVTEECLVGAPATAEEDNPKWRVPFRLPKTIEHFEVRLGPPGGDKVYFFSYLEDVYYLQLSISLYLFFCKINQQ